MALSLSNNNLKLKIESAGEAYKGSRFDWNGTVTQIIWKGIPLLGQEKKLFQRNKRIYGRGLHNEFGIHDCIGYDEVPVGGWFPKIGTGWLKKDEKPYFFYTQYEIDRINFTNEKINDQCAEFVCTSGERNGYSYIYTKRIELTDSGFSIFYKLENTGKKPFTTTEYIHNFFLPGHNSIGKDISLKFGWDFDHNKLGTFNNSNGDIMQSNQNEFAFTNKPKEEFYASDILAAKTDSTAVNTSWTLTDKKNSLAISETGSFKLSECGLWGHDKAISPELIYRFSIDSGDILTWERRYKIQEL